MRPLTRLPGRRPTLHPGDEGAGHRRGPVIACLTLLVLAAVWLLSDAILGGKILAPGDLTLFAVPPFSSNRPPGLLRAANPTLTDVVFVIEPYLLHAREAIRGGRLPIWDPSVGTGRPLGAQAAAQLFPTSWLAYVLPFWRSLGFIALAKLLLTAGGTFLFARALRLRPVAAAVAAGAFAFGTQYVVWLGHSMTDVVALLPWMFLFAERVCVRSRAADAAGLGLTIGIAQFGGHPESLVVALTGTVAYLIARLARGPEPIARRLRLLAGAGILAGAVGALYWLPLLELAGQSTRAGRDSPADSIHQLAVGLVLPEWWGRPDKRVFAAGGSGLSSVFVGRAYLGVLPVLLLFGMFAVPRRRAQVFFAGTGLASLGLISGVPGLRWVATHVPPFSLMVIHYFIWLAAFSLAMLAGLALDQLVGAPRARQARALRLMAAGALVPALIAGILHGRALAGAWRGALLQLPAEQLDPASASVAAAGSLLRWLVIAGLLIAAGWAALRFRRLRTACAVFVLGLALADLVTIDRGYQPALPPALADPPAPAALALAGRGGRLAAPGVDLAPNLAELYGRSDVRVEDLPEIERYSRVVNALGGSVLRAFGDSVLPPGRDLGEPTATGSTRTLLDLLGATQIIDHGGTDPTGPGLHVVYRAAGERLIDNAQAVPRAFGASAWSPVAGLDGALRVIGGQSAAALARRPVIEGAPAAGPAGPGPGPAPAPARIVASSDTAVTVSVRLPRPGYVVLDDLYYPGWSARVDGRPARILAANGMFRSVAAGAGSHVVRFVYRPASVWIGGALTLLGLVAGGGVILVSRIRRPRARAG